MNTPRQTEIIADLTHLQMALSKYPELSHLTLQLDVIAQKVAGVYRDGKPGLEDLPASPEAKDLSLKSPSEVEETLRKMQESTDLPSLIQRTLEIILKDVKAGRGFKEKFTEAIVEEFRKREASRVSDAGESRTSSGFFGYGMGETGMPKLDEIIASLRKHPAMLSKFWQTIDKNTAAPEEEKTESPANFGDFAFTPAMANKMVSWPGVDARMPDNFRKLSERLAKARDTLAAHSNPTPQEDTQNSDSPTAKSLLESLEKLLMKGNSSRAAASGNSRLPYADLDVFDMDSMYEALQKRILKSMYDGYTWVTSRPLLDQATEAVMAWHDNISKQFRMKVTSTVSRGELLFYAEKLVEMRRNEMQAKQKGEQPSTSVESNTPVLRSNARLADTPTALQAGTFAFTNLLVKKFDTTNLRDPGAAVPPMREFQDIAQRFLKGEILFTGKDFPNIAVAADYPVALSFSVRRKIVENFVAIFSHPFETDYRIRRKYNETVHAMVSVLTEGDPRKADYLVRALAGVAALIGHQLISTT